MKKLMSILLITVLLSSFLTLFSTETSALVKDAATSGKCGDNASWSLSKDGVLTISGTGAIYDFDYTPSAVLNCTSPWFDQRAFIKKVVVEEGITALGDLSFFSCVKLTEAKLPSTLKSIGWGAFNSCVLLTSVNIPKGVTSIEESTFASCESLTSIKIPNSVKTIGEGAFTGSGLTSVTIPDSVTEIGVHAFSFCSKMTTATVSKSISKLPTRMFYQCLKLKTVNLPENGALKIIGFRSFFGCPALDSITIPEGVTNIYQEAFYACTFKTLNIPASVTYISKKAFYCCYSLKTVNMPDSVKCADNAFYYCGDFDPIKITQQPMDVTAPAVGETATVSIKASGSGLKYTWYYKNRNAKEYTRSVKHDPTYSIEMTSARYDRLMYCVVRDRYGRSLRSNAVKLRYVTNPIVITVQPKDTVVANEGDSVKLTVKAKGKGLTYQWYFRNPDSKRWIKSTQTKSSYYTKVLDRRNGRQVYCVIRDRFNKTVTTDIVTVSYSNTLAPVEEVA